MKLPTFLSLTLAHSSNVLFKIDEMWHLMIKISHDVHDAHILNII